MYDGALAHAARPTLTLRARTRTVNDADDPRFAPSESLAVLRRDGRTTYTAVLRLPDSVAYAALAVATADRAAVDDNGGRAWPLLAGDQSGVPTFRARILHANDYLGRNFPQAFREARAAVAASPDSIAGWFLLDFYGQVQYGDRYVDSVRVDRLARLAALEARFGERAQGLEMHAFASLAEMLGDTARARAWTRRLLTAEPTFAYQRERQADALVTRLRERAAVALDSLEAFWRRLGRPERGVALMGVRQAIAAADTSALARWEARYDADDTPARRVTVARLLARSPAFRAEGLARLERLRREPAERRLLPPRLPETRAAYARRALRDDLGVAQTVAETRLALGDSAGALALLDTVAQASTDTALVGRVARLKLARGDSARATRWFARFSAIPGASAASVPPALTARPGWSAAVASAGAALRTQTLAGASRRWVGPLSALDDQRRPRAVASGAPTVVIYWSADCPYSRALLPRIAAAERLVRDLGGRVELVADDAASPEHAKLLGAARLTSVPHLFDADRRLARALGAWVVPSFYVLDGRGTLRFTPGELSEVPLAVAALTR